MATIRQSTINAYAAALIAGACAALVLGTFSLRSAAEDERGAAERERGAAALGDAMYKVSDYLTDRVRSFAATGERAELEAFWAEVDTTRRREAALAQASAVGASEEEFANLALAKKRSDELIEVETRAMRLAAESLGYEEKDMPPRVAARKLSRAEAALSAEAKARAARELVFGQAYWESKRSIRAAINGYLALSEERTAREARDADQRADRAFAWVVGICALAFLGASLAVLAYYRLLALPVRRYIRSLSSKGPEGGYPPLEPQGSAELVKLAEIINLRRAQRLRAERAANDTEIKLRTNLFMMPLGAMEIDFDNRILSWNPAAERIFGFTEEEAIGHDLVELIVPDSAKAQVEEVIDRLGKGDVIDSHVNANLRKDGREIVCEWYNTPMYDSTGEKVGWASLVKDITDERAEAEKVLYLSRHDPLTGLLNRRSMQEKIDEEALRVKRTRGSYATIMLDIDKFKRFNDEHGHECGDEALKMVAGAMAGTARATDSVGRWGGEEFLILLPDTDLAGGLELAEKIRRRIAESRFSYQKATLRLAVTAGVAACLDPDENADDCVRRADEALLAGKTGGRNRVVGA